MSSAEISFPLLGISIDPPSTVFSIGNYSVHWYGVIIAVGFMLAVAYGLKRCKEFGLTQDDVIDMLLLAVPLGIVCARLYYCVFMPDQYLVPGKFKDIIKIWEGGLAIYGGVIGAVIGLFIVCKHKKLSTGAMLDIGGMGLMIGQSIGRWGNFMNREAFGGYTDLPWKMGLTTASGTIYVHPTFLYESLWNALGFLIIHIFSKKKGRKFDGQLFTMYLAWYGFGRFFIEGLRSDSLYITGTSIRVSQLLAAILFVAAVIILIINRNRNPEYLFVNKSKTPSAAVSSDAEVDIDTDN